MHSKTLTFSLLHQLNILYIMYSNMCSKTRLTKFTLIDNQEIVSHLSMLRHACLWVLRQFEIRLTSSRTNFHIRTYYLWTTFLVKEKWKHSLLVLGRTMNKDLYHVNFSTHTVGGRSLGARKTTLNYAYAGRDYIHNTRMEG